MRTEFLGALAILLVLTCPTADVAAASRDWDGGGDGIEWFDANNWDPNGYPEAYDDLTVAFGAPQTASLVQVANGGSIRLSGLGTSASFTYREEFVLGISGTGTLEVRDGALLSTRDSYMGVYPPQTGLATVDGASWEAGNAAGESLSVGFRGTGTLSIRGGGEVLSYDGFVAYQPGSWGQVAVVDPCSAWRCTDSLYVGGSDTGVGGTGEMTVQGGGTAAVGGTLRIYSSGTVYLNTAGTVIADEVDIQGGGTFATWVGSLMRVNALTGFGGNPSFNGSLELGHTGGTSPSSFTFGAGQSLRVDENLLVGYDKAASLAVEAGGGVTVRGTLTVGALGELAIDGGEVRTGSYDNTAGGAVSFPAGTLGVSGGRFDPAPGDFTLDGAGNPTLELTSAATGLVTGHLTVADANSGTLSIAGGAQLASAGGTIAGAAGSSGTVTVDGSGSTWDMGLSDVFVGCEGTGTLAISGGAAVSARLGYIGYETGAVGHVSVDAAEWTNSSHVHVGYRGTGTLEVRNGGRLQTQETVLGDLALSSGTVRVSGAGSSLSTNGENLFVGHRGTGRLEIAGGGEVTDGNALVGWETDSNGTATVTGAGTRWTSTGNLCVGGGYYYDGTEHHGGAGTGTLVISDGAVVSSGDGIIGASDGSTGTVTVEDANWNNTLYLRVGWFGDGALHIRNGAEVTSLRGYIAERSGGMAQVTVEDANWTTGFHLYVGYGGTGSLAITSGGRVSSGLGYIGNAGPASGAVTVEDANSTWDTYGQGLHVGYQGTGVMSVLSAAAVRSGPAYVGTETDGNGTVTVAGLGSTWDTGAQELHVGDKASGTASILSGGVISSGKAYLGYQATGSGTVTVGGAGSTLDAGGQALHVGRSGTGDLTIQSGGLVSSGVGYVAWLAGSTGAVTVRDPNSTWQTGGNDLHVGHEGTGELRIQSGGSVWSGKGHVGHDPGSSGTVTVEDANSVWEAGGAELHVGNGGRGEMHVLSGGTVASGEGFIGDQAGASGAVTVEGAGSTWDTGGGNLHVGHHGTGVLAIRSGGSVSSGRGNVAHQPGSSGTVTVEGAGSTWDAGGDDLYIGQKGPGSLVIQSGGSVSCTGGYIGHVDAGSGTVTVRDPNSTWDTGGANLHVGNYAAGVLAIQSGGSVLSGTGLIGCEAVGTGTVTVEGSGSTWDTAEAELNVGEKGSGTVEILSGGLVFTGAAHIAHRAGSSGGVTLDGAGSTWEVGGGNLKVGVEAVGTLMIRAGGSVLSGTALIGYEAVGTGTVTVEGIGSTWDAGEAELNVGEKGSGTLEILSGGLVSSGAAHIAHRAGSSGSVTLDGAGSTWETGGGNLNVGVEAVGTLMVRAGGSVLSGTGLIGYEATGSGAVTVRDANSAWDAGGEHLHVGYAGIGTLDILSGGSVSNGQGHIGREADSNGTVTVDGGGSTWGSSGELIVADQGNGTLTITNGGEVTSAGGCVAWDTHANGLVTVSGAGSTWDTGGGNLDVGEYGTGTLEIRSGGGVSCAKGYLGHKYSGEGAVSVDGSGSAWSVDGLLSLGEDGNGTLEITEGGAVSCGVAIIGGVQGRARVDGPGSTLAIADSVIVAYSGTGVLEVANGGVVSSRNAMVADRLGSIGTAAVDGPGSMWDLGDRLLVVGVQGRATLEITGAAAVTNGTGAIGDSPDANGTATVDGAGSIWTNSVNLLVGLDGIATLNVRNDGCVFVGDELEIGPRGTINLDGGTVTTGQLDGFGGLLNFTGGTLQVTAGGVHLAAGEPLGTSLTLTGEHVLEVADTTTVGAGASLTIDGGRLTTGYLDGGGSVSFVVGTLQITLGGLSLGPGELLGMSMTLGDGDLLDVAGTTTVGGGAALAVTGGTLISGSLQNDGSLYVGDGGSVTTTAGLTNSADMYLWAGTVAGGTVTNDYGGLLQAAGTIDAALHNYGTLRTTGVLIVTGPVVNYGLADVEAGTSIRQDAGLSNHGVIDLRGGAITGTGPVTNFPGGVIRGGSALAAGAVRNDGLIHATGAGVLVVVDLSGGNTQTGELRIADGALDVPSGFTNDGLVSLQGDAALSGGTIENRGTISGHGRIANAITNEGAIQAAGGRLTLAGSVWHWDPNGVIEALDGAVAFAAMGMPYNGTRIVLRGGTFDNNGQPICNTGSLTGHGAFRSGGMTNDQHVAVGGGDLEVIGPVEHADEATFRVEADCAAIFHGDVTGPGSFTGEGTILFLAGYSPGGSAGVIDFGGDVAFGPAASLNIELANDDNSDPLEPRYDSLAIAGDVALAGTLSVEWLPIEGDPNSKFGGVYDILSYGGTRTGVFDGIDCRMAAYLDTSLFDDGIEYDDANGEVKVHLYDLLDGDADLDGRVAREDFAALQDGFASPDPDWFTADFNFDGSVNFLDYLTWKANVGDAVPGAGKIPEPASAVLLLLGFAAVTCRRLGK